MHELFTACVAPSPCSGVAVLIGMQYITYGRCSLLQLLIMINPRPDLKGLRILVSVMHVDLIKVCTRDLLYTAHPCQCASVAMYLNVSAMYLSQTISIEHDNVGRSSAVHASDI